MTIGDNPDAVTFDVTDWEIVEGGRMDDDSFGRFVVLVGGALVAIGLVLLGLYFLQ